LSQLSFAFSALFADQFLSHGPSSFFLPSCRFPFSVNYPSTKPLLRWQWTIFPSQYRELPPLHEAFAGLDCSAPSRSVTLILRPGVLWFFPILPPLIMCLKKFSIFCHVFANFPPLGVFYDLSLLLSLFPISPSHRSTSYRSVFLFFLVRWTGPQPAEGLPSLQTASNGTPHFWLFPASPPLLPVIFFAASPRTQYDQLWSSPFPCCVL